jgi:peptidoglycan/LPS O-acetylase OafA/YrhL
MLIYRAEIDGLRAIAVLSVMVYHADAAWLPGGFLGVDVFFVISGYLITSLILNDLRQGRFSFANFYERRARRILPALFLVVIACIPIAVLTMRPSQLEAFAQSVLATTLFSSNFLFWLEAGYFMAEAELKPLLHTWSLAVEEQYYLLFPLVMFILPWRSLKMTALCLGLVCVASFATAVYLADAAPAANFYLLPSRAWELMAGALCAVVGLRQNRLAPLLSALGLALIIGSFIQVSAAMSTPSWPTLPLVLGTVLVILFASPKGGPAEWLLTTRPMVQVGLISYSAYLWHFPLLAFARLSSPSPLTDFQALGLLFVALILAYLSYRLVEQPFRKRGSAAVVSRRALVGGFGTTAALLLAFAGSFQFGAFDRPPGAIDIDAKLATNFGLHQDCEGSFTLSENCRTSEFPQTLLWGDSFAMHLAPALEKGTAWGGLVQHTKSVCAPVPGLAVVTPEYPESWARGCLEFNEQVLAWLEQQPSIKYVVVSSPFGLIHHHLLQPDGRLAIEGQPELVRNNIIGLYERIKDMGKSFVVVSPPPVTGENLGHCLATVLKADGDRTRCDFARADAHPASHFMYNYLATWTQDVPVLFLDKFICPDGLCDTMVGDIFLFRDEGHLSIEGARFIGAERDFWGMLLTTATAQK